MAVEVLETVIKRFLHTNKILSALRIYAYQYINVINYAMLRLNDTNEEKLEETLEDNNDLIDVKKNYVYKLFVKLLFLECCYCCK